MKNITVNIVFMLAGVTIGVLTNNMITNTDKNGTSLVSNLDGNKVLLDIDGQLKELKVQISHNQRLNSINALPKEFNSTPSKLNNSATISETDYDKQFAHLSNTLQQELDTLASTVLGALDLVNIELKQISDSGRNYRDIPVAVKTCMSSTSASIAQDVNYTEIESALDNIDISDRVALDQIIEKAMRANLHVSHLEKFDREIQKMYEASE